MKPIQGYKQFFDKIDAAYTDMVAWATEYQQTDNITLNESVSYFWATDNDDSRSVKPYKKNPLLHIGEFTAYRNGEAVKHKRISLWYTLSNYNGRAKYEDIIAKSETFKLVHSQDGYEFYLLRDNLRRPTDTYWGYKYIYTIGKKHYPHKFVIKKDGEEIFSCFERWELEGFCIDGGLIEEEEKTPETPSEIFRYFNPFKLIIVPFDERKYSNIRELAKRLDINDPIGEYNTLVSLGYLDETPKNQWLVVIMGLPELRRNSYDKRNATWWIMGSKNKPTNDDALYHVMSELDMFDTDTFTEYLIKIREEFETNLNTLNIRAHERLHHLYNNKLMGKIQDIVGVRYEKLKDFWDENINY